MAEVFFVLKTLVATFILLVLMQIKIGGAAVETHMHRWIKRSAVVETLRGVAQGAVALVDKSYDSTLAMIEGKPARGKASDYGREQRAAASTLELDLDRSNFKWDDEKENENKDETALEDESAKEDESSAADDSI